MALINCSECSREVSDRAAACPQCGAPVATAAPVLQTPARTESAPVSSEEKSRTFAAMLAIVFGIIGAHKFYLDRPLWGIFYLLSCWTFIPAVLGILEGLGYLGMSEQAFQAKYGPNGYSRGL